MLLVLAEFLMMAVEWGWRNVVVPFISVLILSLLSLLLILSPCNVIWTLFCFTLMQCHTVALKVGRQRNHCTWT